MADHPLQAAADRFVRPLSLAVLESVGAARDALSADRLEALLDRRDMQALGAFLERSVEAMERSLLGQRGEKASGSKVDGVAEVVAGALAAGANGVETCVVDAEEVRYSLSGGPARPGWQDSLSDAERKALRDYGMGGKWEPLNRALREGGELSPDQREMRSLLDSAIAKAGRYADPVTVFRGVNFGSAGMPSGLELARATNSEELIRRSIASYAKERFQPGAIIELGGYQSTSFRVEPALDAALSRRNPGVVFEIRTRRGAYLDKLAGYDDEAELLMGRGSRFKVVRVIDRVPFETESGRMSYRTVVQLEEQ